MQRISIILIEDHRIVRQGLRLLLEEDDRFHVVDECADGLQAADMVRKLTPDVVLMDLGLPGIGGLEVISQITRTTPQVRIVVLSMHANEVHVREAFRRGACAYVLKDAGGDQLIRAICEAAEGRQYLSPPLDPDVLTALESGRSESPERTLTLREKQIANMVAEGLSAKEIAVRLAISPRTVELHRSNAIRKLGLRNLAELVRVMHESRAPNS